MSNPYLSCSAAEHRQSAPSSVSCAVVTVSDTRTVENDSSGQLLVDQLQAAGHTIAVRQIVPDDEAPLQELVGQLAAREDVEVILLTGGTGIAVRDRTPEAVEPLLTKTLPGFGELMRVLSYEQIGAAAMLSRAFGGLIGTTIVLALPGSKPAVQLALDKLILPELGHLVKHTRR